MLIEAISIAGAGFFRAFSGWLENSLQDGKIQTVEWVKLGETAIRFTVIGAGVYFGTDLEPVAAGAVTLLASLVYDKLNKTSQTKKKR